MGLEIVDELKKDYIADLAKKNTRIDGRSFDEYRPISVERDIIKKAEGSARVKIGNTEVLVGVKMELGEPFPDTPDVGVIITNAELVPLASPTFESGPPNENSIELARVVDRGIRESGAIDLEKMCIEEGKKVWIIFIDVHVLDHDGNLWDASTLGAISALSNVVIPQEKYGLDLVEKGEVGGEGKNENKNNDKYILPLRDTPVAVTMVEIEGNILVDPNLYEEIAASSRLTVISNVDGALSGMQKGGGELSSEKAIEMVRIGIEKGEEIRKTVLKLKNE
jgi:exosome complex component RRP42